MEECHRFSGNPENCPILVDFMLSKKRIYGIETIQSFLTMFTFIIFRKSISKSGGDI